MTTRVAAARVRERRLELGLSERKVAALTGLSQSVVRGLEAGITGKDLQLGELNRVADALHMALTELLDAGAPCDRTSEAQHEGTPAGPPTRSEFHERYVPQAGALLHEVDRLIPVEAVALALGPNLDDTHGVLDSLHRCLHAAGLGVHRLNNSVRIRRTHGASSAGQLERSWRMHLGRRGLDIGQVRLLHQTHVGRRQKTLTNDQQVTASELVNAGILTRTPSGGVGLSDDARYSLLLTLPSLPRRTERPRVVP